MADRLLIDYLPNAFKDIKEFQAIFNAEQPEIDALWQEKDKIVENAFIDSMDESAILRWEEKLGIFPKDTESLEDRRFRIKSIAQARLPYTQRSLRRSLINLVGYGNFTLSIDSDTYTAHITVALGARGLLSDVKSLAEKMVPLNMILNVELLYTTYGKLRPLTHAELARYKHAEVRELKVYDG